MDPWIDLGSMDIHDEGGQSWFEDCPFFFSFCFFFTSVKRDVEEVSFPKVITRRIVLIILY